MNMKLKTKINIYTKHPIIQKIHDYLNKTNKNYKFLWIPSHTGIPMNDKVDNFAKNSLLEPIHSQFSFIANDLKALIKSKLI